MWKKIDTFVKEQKIIEPGDCILLGLSGGADSILLARYLLTLRERGEITFCAVHVNHQIRPGEAERDEAFVAQFCETWEIPCDIYRENVIAYAKEQKMSLEEAGREVRTQCMARSMEKRKCNKIALAHHAVDLAETMLFRMMRGTGVEGLAGIYPVNGPKIRPLLSVEKGEILWILQKLGQDYVEDTTNQETEYTRNYIRHVILPSMQQVNAQVIPHMMQLSKQVQEERDYLKQQMDAIFHQHCVLDEESARISTTFLQQCHPFEQKEMIRRMLFYVAGSRKDLRAIHIEQVLALLDKARGKSCNLPYEMVAMREEEQLLVRSGAGQPNIASEEMVSKERMSQKISRKYEIDRKHLLCGEPISMTIGNDIFSLQITEKELPKDVKRDCVKYFDYDKIKGNVVFRTRMEGDYFVMNAAGQTKKLKRYMIDEKIPADKRDSVWLLADGSHILWVVGGRISEEYKVTETTRNILCVKHYRDKDNSEVHYGS